MGFIYYCATLYCVICDVCIIVLQQFMNVGFDALLCLCIMELQDLCINGLSDLVIVFPHIRAVYYLSVE